MRRCRPRPCASSSRWRRRSPAGWTIFPPAPAPRPMFNAAAGVKLVHVPFKGNAEGMNALLGGHVKVYFAQVSAVLQHVRAGTLRAIAVTTNARIASLPDVPTIAELGFPGYEISTWQGMFAPAGPPRDGA